MIKNNLKQRTVLALLAVAFGCGALFSLFSVSPGSASQEHLAQGIVSVKDSWFFPGKFHAVAAITVVPLALMVIFLTNCFSGQNKIIKHYVLIRLKRVEQWFWPNSCSVFLLSMAAAIVYCLTGLGVCLAMGYRAVAPGLTALVFLYAVCVTGLTLFLLGQISVYLCFFTEEKSALIITLGILTVSCVIAFVLPPQVTQYFWLSQYYVLWHAPETKLMQLLQNGVRDNGMQITYLFSIGYLTLLAAGETVLLRAVLRKRDFI